MLWLPCEDDIDYGQPFNYENDLGLLAPIAWYLALPGLTGGPKFLSVMELGNGNGRHGTLTNGASFSAIAPPGGTGSILSDSVNDYVLATLPAAPATWHANFWMYRTATSGFEGICAFANGLSLMWWSGQGFGINTFNSDMFGISDSNFTTLVPVNTWTHCSCCFVSGAVASTKLWINGIPQSVSQITGSPGTGNTTVNWYMAGHPSSGNAWGGNSDGYMCFDRELTTDAVVALYRDSLLAYPSLLNRIRRPVVADLAAGRTTKNTRAFPLGVEVGMNWLQSNI